MSRDASSLRSSLQTMQGDLGGSRTMTLRVTHRWRGEGVMLNFRQGKAVRSAATAAGGQIGTTNFPPFYCYDVHTKKRQQQ